LIEKWTELKIYAEFKSQFKIKGKRDQEHQDLYWFTLPQEQHPISLPQEKNFTEEHKCSTITHKNESYTLQEHTKNSAEPYCTPTTVNPIQL